ncbi:transposase-like protein, IS1167 [Streptococcus pneumoniae]|nr:transposase-like protein, IS1167 [Streptococcus pneumoniae]VQE12835.1 transposase-like protein, IS1167 [Streptococcus pneumoniae]VQF05993.1 transposase-like protein, IS1167 [Streptococcus pneumoniae]VTE78167.1 transposase-like protein, IS1167 [Streptococcus pneumoniae]
MHLTNKEILNKLLSKKKKKKKKKKLYQLLLFHFQNKEPEKFFGLIEDLIKLIKRNAFGFRNFENFKKRIFIALNIKKERTKFVLSRA